MTLVSEIINDAYRQSNLIAIGVSATTLQETEALRYLNRIVKGVFGMEVGDRLTAFPIGANNRTNPPGYPWWGDGVPDSSWFVPKNTRLALNLTADTDVYLHPAPSNGTRFAYSDQSNNLATNSLTIHGNGAMIDGATSVTVNTNGADAEYFYREDLGEWKRYATLTLFDTFPFPEELDDFFILSLAFRLNPAYERAFDEQSLVHYRRQKSMIASLYKQDEQRRVELGLLMYSRLAGDRDYYKYDSSYDDNSNFERGRPW